MPRRQEVMICRLRIGHTRVTHSYLMNREVEPFCDDCLVPLTVKHLLAECPSLRELRNRFLLKYREEDGSFNLTRILGADLENSRDVFNFLSEAGLLEKI